MAREAVLEQNGADVAVVLDRIVGGMSSAQPDASARYRGEAG
jgi:hypothetical protein